MDKKFTAMLAFACVILLLSPGKARSHISECHPQCFIALTDNNGAILIDKKGSIIDDQSIVGGSGEGVVSASDGYAMISRFVSREIWIYDLRDGQELCHLPLPSYLAGRGVAYDGYAWITHPENYLVSKIDLATCVITFIQLNAIGYGGIELAQNMIWIVNSQNGDIVQIDPVTHLKTYLASGLLSDNQPHSLKFNGTGFFISGTQPTLLGAIWETGMPPQNNSINWGSALFPLSDMEANQDYVVSSASAGDTMYIFPTSDPTPITQPVAGILSVALIDDVVMAAGGQSPDIGLFMFSGSNGFTKSASPIISFETYSVTSSGTFETCGNDWAEASEICDGLDLNGETCISLGFTSGDLVCAADCGGFDTTICYNCGDGVADPTELCDDEDLKGETCVSKGYEWGQLECNATCDGYIETNCAICGDGIINSPIEQCDGEDLGGKTCFDHGFAGGDLSCRDNCTVNITGCIPPETQDPYCGDGIRNSNEVCDGTDLHGFTCTDLMHAGGELMCKPDCKGLDTSHCIPNDFGGCHCSSQNNANPPMWFAFILLVALRLRKRRQ